MFDEQEKNEIIPENENTKINPENKESDTGAQQPESFDIFSYLKRETPSNPADEAKAYTPTPPADPVPAAEPEQPVVNLPDPGGPEPQKPEYPAYTPSPEVVIEMNDPETPASQPYTPSQPAQPVVSQPVQPASSGSYMPRPQAVPQSEQYSEQTKKKDTGSFMKKNGLYIALTAVSLLLVLAIISNIALLGMVLKKSGIQLGGSGTSSSETVSSNGAALDIAQSPKTDTALVPGSSEKLTYAQIAAKVRPSVVSIITYDAASFGQNSGQGSGIIYSSDGYIVTNAHVINSSRSVHVTVVLSDEKEYDAKILGYDTRTDIAVLKIEATGLTAAEFGESDKLVAGDEVIAIGNPGGEQFAGSITNGIVSGIDRVIDADSSSASAMKYIQTNAAINPGNSGGALVNIYGQVIGINTAKISATGYEGLGFAIPIATAKPVIDELSSIGYVSGRVKLGITCTEVTSSMAMYYNVPTGLLIYSIEQDSELNGKAEEGDIISKVDGKDISSLSEMQDIFLNKKAGDTVELEIYRPAVSRFHQASTFTVSVHLLEDKGDRETQKANEF